MKKKILGLALGVTLLIGLQHQTALADPMTASASSAQLSAVQSSVAQPAYYYGRRTVVRGPAHGCAGGRRCVGGYYHGVCRSWAACR